MTSSNQETTDGTTPIDASTTPAGADAVPGDAGAAPAVMVRKPRASRRIPKSDVVLEAAVERARQGVLEVAPEAQVGRHVSAVVEGERLVTHRFEAFLPGYGGWQWYASVARVSRSKEVTVCEVGLLPSAASLIAPEWLPWSERVRPEDSEPDGPVTDAPLPDTPFAADTSLTDDAAGSGSDASVAADGLIPDVEPAGDEPAGELSDDGLIPDVEPADDEPADDEPAGDEPADDEEAGSGLTEDEPIDGPAEDELTDSYSTDDAERPDAG